MKVLLVSQEVPPETAWGGIGTYIGIVAPALARAGAEVHVLSVVPDQAPSVTEQPDGVTVHRTSTIRLRGPGRVARMPHTWRRLHLATSVARAVRRLDFVPDVIECPEWNAEGFVLARRRVAPLVVRSHSSAAQILPFVGPTSLDTRAAAWFEDDTMRRAGVVTGPAGQIAAEGARARIPPERLRAIPYPVVPRDRPTVAVDPERICFVGRFERRKGPDTVVRALARVRRHVSGAHLIMIGRDMSDADHPSFADHLRKLAGDLGVADAVDIRDRWVPHGEVAEAMAGSAVCVAPSRWESFGLVAGEAAALGRPVLASDIAGLQDAVVDGHTGRLLPPEDPDAWAEALAEVLLDPDLAPAMGRRGAEHIATHCHPDRVATLTLEAYAAALLESSTPAATTSTPEAATPGAPSWP